MRYIKCFEKYDYTIERYFKKKVNLKDIELLADKLMYVEDMGYNTQLSINLGHPPRAYDCIATVYRHPDISISYASKPENSREFRYDIEYLKKLYKENGLFYLITIINPDDVYSDNSEIINNFCKRLEGKFTRVPYDSIFAHYHTFCLKKVG